jgi:hypothetical protein
MRLAAVVVACALLSARTADADKLPSGAIGAVVGLVSGTGADAKRLGFGVYTFGLQAAWSPMSTEQNIGWSVRWSTMFGWFYGGNAARIDSTLRTVQMDLSAGGRFRPWPNPRRYLTARVGAQLFRSNQPIALAGEAETMSDREFIGGVATVGFEQYLGSTLLSIDVRYGLVPEGPKHVALLVGFALTGP